MKTRRLFEKAKHRYSADAVSASRIFTAGGRMVDGEGKTALLKCALSKLAGQALQRKKDHEANTTPAAQPLLQTAEVA